MDATRTVTDAFGSTATKSLTVTIQNATGLSAPPANGPDLVTLGVIGGVVAMVAIAAIVLLMRRRQPPAP